MCACFTSAQAVLIQGAKAFGKHLLHCGRSGNSGWASQMNENDQSGSLKPADSGLGGGGNQQDQSRSPVPPCLPKSTPLSLLGLPGASGGSQTQRTSFTLGGIGLTSRLECRALCAKPGWSLGASPLGNARLPFKSSLGTLPLFAKHRAILCAIFNLSTMLLQRACALRGCACETEGVAQTAVLGTASH